MFSDNKILKIKLNKDQFKMNKFKQTEFNYTYKLQIWVKLYKHICALSPNINKLDAYLKNEFNHS